MLKMAFALVFFVLCYLMQTIAYQSSLYYSTVSLQKLVENQQQAINHMEEFLANIEEKSSQHIDAVKEYIRSYKDMVATDDLVTEILMHPISGFHFFKHVVIEWHDLMNLTKEDTLFQDLFFNLTRFRASQDFADTHDLHNTAASIGRMQYMYQIPMDDMVEGVIKSNGSQKNVYKSWKGLDSWDCLTIGASTYKRNYVKPAIDWLQTAHTLVLEDKKVPLYRITDLLKVAVWRQQRKDRSVQVEVLEETMGTLCRGEHLFNNRSESKLVCKYSTRGEAYLLIAPFKVEVLSENPPIMGFHDFLSEREANRMKEIASPKLISSVVMTEKNDGETFERTSQQYWMGNSEDPTLSLGLSRRIEQATGLLTDVSKPEASCIAEQYQVLNYGIGGLYLTHRDYIAFSEGYKSDYWYLNGGDRISTFLIYLNDVEVGGATVFPKADVIVWPKKGFAAFWYNLLSDGTPDPNTEHGGCPVLYGSKWISNKWIHEKFQDKVKCGLNKGEVYKIVD